MGHYCASVRKIGAKKTGSNDFLRPSRLTSVSHRTGILHVIYTLRLFLSTLVVFCPGFNNWSSDYVTLYQPASVVRVPHNIAYTLAISSTIRWRRVAKKKSSPATKPCLSAFVVHRRALFPHLYIEQFFFPFTFYSVYLLYFDAICIRPPPLSVNTPGVLSPFGNEGSGTPLPVSFLHSGRFIQCFFIVEAYCPIAFAYFSVLHDFVLSFNNSPTVYINEFSILVQDRDIHWHLHNEIKKYI